MLSFFAGRSSPLSKALERTSFRSVVSDPWLALST